MSDDQAAGERIARLEGLLEALESLDDGAARDTGLQTVQTLVEVYGEGMSRLLAAMTPEQLAGAADDELVEHLLLLHGLHPVDAETRVRGALEGVRPYLESHGGDVELVEVQDGVARVRLSGSCQGCPSSTMTLKLAIEDAIHKAAPDVESVEAVGAAETAPAPGLLQLTVTDEAVGNGNGATDWAVAGGLPQLAGGGTLLKQVAGAELLFVRVEEDLYAYRPRCPGCGATPEQLEGAELRCAGCGRGFDVRRAGRCLDSPDLHLEPVPLLVDDAGLAKVALA
jgi:Fe-S cluster biogenesis protein NfuA/nitrite reductase/ring-hydroxylating ferredoxin subunit